MRLPQIAAKRTPERNEKLIHVASEKFEFFKLVLHRNEQCGFEQEPKHHTILEKFHRKLRQIERPVLRALMNAQGPEERIPAFSNNRMQDSNRRASQVIPIF
jgi:hypothetical protein